MPSRGRLNKPAMRDRDAAPTAREFSGQTLGLAVSEEHGMLPLHIAGGARILVYPKLDHARARST